jgi:hypothetical protein
MVFVNERRMMMQRQVIVCKPMWLVLLSICLLAATSTIRARIEVSHDGLTKRTIVLPRRNLSKLQPSSSITDLNKARRLRASALPMKKAKTPVKQQLDFIIAGFPKCGTTTLLYALRAHQGTDISSSERCAVANTGLSDDQALEVLNNAAVELSSSPHIKRGIKCPTILRSYKTIARIEQHSPSAKFVVGLRHPIEMLESFYNYRVTESYNNKLQEPIPSFDDVVRRTKPWKGISRDTPRFDRNLMQFGKTLMTKTDLEHFVGQKDMAVRPSKAKIFLYSLDQLNESNEHRSRPFRRDLQTFLGLEKPLDPMGHENLNNFVGKKAHPETVDICEDKYRGLRKKLLARGKQMASWIRDEFMESPDVSVGNEKQFLKSLASWSVDPCAKRPAQPVVYVKRAKRKKRVDGKQSPL